MNAWGIFWMVVFSVVAATSCVAVGWGMQFAMVRTFLRHLDAHEQRCADINKEIQKTSHEFHRLLNDNIREAFKEVVKVIGEARDTMGTSSVASTGILKFLATKDFPDVQVDEGMKGPE
jgi:hypothetical protein